MTKKKTTVAAALVLAAFAATAVPESESGPGAILRLINSRAAGSPRSFVKAAEVVARDAAKGHPLQQYVIALMADDPLLPESARVTPATRSLYLDNARGKLKALAERKGNALAWYLLSREANDESMLKKAADGGNVQALNAWGTLTLTRALSSQTMSQSEVELAVERGVNCFRRAASQKDANGIYNLGMCYMRGYGCPESPDKALDCFRTAAESGHTEAVNNIGGLYRDGIVVERDLFAAARWFAKSAEMGNAYGQLNYALALRRGEGVDKDPEMAAAYMLASAKQGNSAAMNEYATMLRAGEGVGADARAAVRWFRASAEQGYPVAMENLAVCYEEGFGGLPKDIKTATVWKVRARAARGDRNAVAWLAQNGHGLK